VRVKRFKGGGEGRGERVGGDRGKGEKYAKAG